MHDPKHFSANDSFHVKTFTSTKMKTTDQKYHSPELDFCIPTSINSDYDRRTECSQWPSVYCPAIYFNHLSSLIRNIYIITYQKCHCVGNKCFGVLLFCS